MLNGGGKKCEAKIIMFKGEKGEPGGSTWGNISGTLSNQTDLTLR